MGGSCSRFSPRCIPSGNGKLFGILLHNRWKKRLQGDVPADFHGWVPQRKAAEMNFAVNQVIEKAWEHGRSVYLGKLDIAKAFDLTPHLCIARSMLDRGIAPAYVAAYLRSLRMNPFTFRVLGGVGPRMHIWIRRGTLQGHAASPEVFVAVLADVFSGKRDDDSIPHLLHQHEENKQVFEIRGGSLEQLYFADDGIFLARSRTSLERIMTITIARFRYSGFAVNLAK